MAIRKTKNKVVKKVKATARKAKSAVKKMLAGAKKVVKKTVAKKKAMAEKKPAPKKKMKLAVKVQKKTVSVKKGTAERNTVAKKAKPSIKDSSTQKKVKKTVAKKPFVEPKAPEAIIPGENMHFIPEQGETPTVKAPETIHIAENNFHHKEEVALHQENNKVNNALSSRKNLKKLYNSRGRR